MVSGTIEGKVISVAENGNLVTDIAESQLGDAPRDERLTVSCDEHETLGLFSAGHDQPESTFIAVVGESGSVELEIVGLEASIMLGIRVGQPVTLSW